MKDSAMLVSESKEILKVGDWVVVKYNNDNAPVMGEIGEISGDRFYVWQNKNDGSPGAISPSTRGYKYSWAVQFSGNLSKVIVLEGGVEYKWNKKTKNMAKKMKHIKLSLERRDNELGFSIKLPKEFEELFAKMSDGKTQKSSTWKKEDGSEAEFYILTNEYKELEERLNGIIPHCNDYGARLFQRERVNLAPLRTVGTAKGCFIRSDRFDELSNLDFKFYLEQLGRCAKRFWEGMIQEKKVCATITFEIE